MSAQEEIDTRRRAWIAAVNEGSLDRYADLMARDIVWVPPGVDAIVGRTAVREWLAPFFETYDYAFDLAVESLRPAGTIAVERGSFRSRMVPRTGDDPMEHGGRYLVLWRRDGGAWRIDRYVDRAIRASG